MSRNSHIDLLADKFVTVDLQGNNSAKRDSAQMKTLQVAVKRPPFDLLGGVHWLSYNSWKSLPILRVKINVMG
jgi:hypothetical protein